MYSRNITYKRKADRTGLFFILTVLMSFLLTGFGIWAIVEFILYLVKDNPFNWTSLWLTIGAFVGEIFFLIKTMLAD